MNNCSSQIRLFPQYLFAYSCVNFSVKPVKRFRTKLHHTFSSKINAAFSTLRWISILTAALNEPSPVTTEYFKLWLIIVIHTIPLFFNPYDVVSGKFQSAYFVLSRNVRFRRSYWTVQIYFIKFSGNTVHWYLNAKISISSFRDSGCCCKLILFLIHYESILCSRFPRPARWFLGFTWPSFFWFS